MYRYYPDGQRKTKHVLGEDFSRFYYDGDNVINEANSDNSEKASYLRGLGIVYRDYNSKKAYYHYNGHGDTVALTNEAGDVIKNYDYMAYGEELTIDNSDIYNPFRYSGEYTDDESGMQYLRARYYNPSIKRFVTGHSSNLLLKNKRRKNSKPFDKFNIISRGRTSLDISFTNYLGYI